MARTLMTETAMLFAVKIDNITFTAVDSANGMRFAPAASQVLLVKNVSGSAITCTITLPADRAGRTGTKVLTVPATTGLGCAGPFPVGTFAQTTGDDSGFVQVDFSVTTNVTYALLEVREA